jgi:hypothetical protein
MNCGSDLDFDTNHPVIGLTNEEDAIRSVKEHTCLEGTIIKEFPDYMWLDVESKVWWHYHPFLMEVKSRKIVLKVDGKHSEYRWVKLEEIPRFSRLNYLEYVLKKTILKV